MRDVYAYALKGIESISQAPVRRFAGFGYTSNLDRVLRHPVACLNRLFARYRICRPQHAPGPALETIEDFAGAVLYYAAQGLGAEFLISDAIARLLHESFKMKDGVGGTGAQAAMASAALGCPAVLHATERSRALAALLSYDRLFLVRNSELVSAAQLENPMPPSPHYIMLLEKGMVIHAEDGTLEIPESNRLIFNYDRLNPLLPLDEQYLRYLQTHAGSFFSHVTSGLNVILDGTVLTARAETMAVHARRLRAENPDIAFYLEDAFYLNPTAKLCAYRRLIPQMDFLGINEEELFQTARLLGCAPQNSFAADIVRCAQCILRALKPRCGIIVHTRDVSVYIGQACRWDMETALAAGNLTAAARAQTGAYGTCCQMKRLAGLAMSKRGGALSEEIKRMQADCVLLAVPGLAIGPPRTTVGLGDSFVGGLQTGFYPHRN